MKVNKRNHTCYSIGSFSDLGTISSEVPHIGKVVGKQFVGALLETTGMEMSLNRMDVGQGMPRLHAHTLNEEVYLFLSGEGEFVVDGEQFPVGEGSLVRVGPEGKRAWRNVGKEPLIYVCVQAIANSGISRGIEDGKLVPEPLHWSA